FKQPFLAFCMVIFMLSLIGIPPVAGFMAKFYLFSAALKNGFIWLTVIAVVNSVVSAYFYLRILVNMYMQADNSSLVIKPLLGGPKVVIFATALCLLIFGLLPQYLLFLGDFLR